MPDRSQEKSLSLVDNSGSKDEIEKLRAIINTVIDGVISIDQSGVITSFNFAASQMFGYNPEEVLGKNIRTLMPEPYRSEHDGYLERYKTTRVKNIIGIGREAKGLKKDGSTFPLDLSITEANINGEQIFIGTIRDITNTKRNEELIARLGSIVNDSSDEIYILSQETLSFIQTNESARNNLGYNNQELTKINFSDLLPHSTGKIFPRFLSQLHETGSSRISFETELKRKDGTCYPVEVKIYLSSFELEKVYIAIIQDITERKLSERALKEKNSQIELRSHYDRAARLIMAKSNVTYNADEVLHDSLAILADELEYKSSAVYIFDEWTGCLHLKASYAPPPGLNKIFRLGEGMIGQAAAEKKPFVIDDVPDNSFLTIDTGIVSIKPKAVLIYPFFYQERVMGVIALASLKLPSKNDLTFIEGLLSQLAIALNSLKHYNDLKELSDQLKKRGREIAEKNAELEQANRMKSEFLANISHELRTPLNAVIGFSEVLKDGILGELTEKQEEYASDIFKSGQHLLSLINDILDLSKIEAGKMSLDPELVNMKELIRNSVSIVKERAFSKKITLSQSVDEDINPIMADARQIKQIVYNLLSNAVKFTPNEGKVSIRGYKEDGHFIIEVKDNGIGISQEDLARLFKPFEQLDSSVARKYEGTGLGLVLAKRFAELHNGSIKVESKTGEGSCFSVHIPYRTDSENTLPADNAVDETIYNILNKQKDLLQLTTVKDNTKSLLNQAGLQGYKVHKIFSPVSLLKHIRFSLPQLVVIDDKISPNDCFTILDKVNALSTSLPILFLGNGLGHIPERIPAGLAGGDSPSDNNELIGTLTAFQQTLAKEPEDTKILIVDDDPHAVELISQNLERYNYTTFRSYSGEEAIEASTIEKPDVMILDLLMPNITGFDVIQAIKSNPETSDIAIIILSSASLSHQETSRLSRDVLKVISKSNLGSYGNVDLTSVTHQNISNPLSNNKALPKIAILTEDSQKYQPLAELLAHYNFSTATISAEELLRLKQKDRPDFILASYVHDAPQIKYYLNKIQTLNDKDHQPLFVYNNLDITFSNAPNELPDSYLDVISILGLQPIADVQNTVLVIDDDAKSADILVSTLSDAGFRVLTATSGKEGVSAAKQQLPDAIIIDLVMSDLSGFDVVEGLKQDPNTRSIPIAVLVTKHLSKKDHAILSNHVEIIAHKYETRRRELINNIRKLCDHRSQS